MLFPQMFFLRSIRQKISAYGILIVLITTVVIGGFAYNRIEKITVDTAIQGLRDETRLMSMRFWGEYHEMENDVGVIAGTPPIQGLIRSIRHHNIDPVDHSSTQLWINRLEEIFSSMLKARPHYTQIRYIQIANNGKELVRIEQKELKIQAVRDPDLQEKKDETYFKQVLDNPEQDIIFSEVTLNREHGRISPDRTPTVRVMHPIKDPQGRLFGFLIINADYNEMLKNAFSHIKSRKHIIISNDKKDYMSYFRDGTISELSLSSTRTIAPPPFVTKLWSTQNLEGVLIESSDVAYFFKPDISYQENKHKHKHPGIAVAISMPMDELLAGAHKTRRDILSLAAAIILLVMLTTWLLSRRLTGPLNRMTDTIKNTPSNDHLLDLPTELNDEIGDLARAFNQKTLSLIESENKVRGILDSVADGIITIQFDGTILSYNPACERLFAYPEDKMIGQHIRTLIPVIGTECVGISQNGAELMLGVTISHTQHETHPTTILCIRDITQETRIRRMKDEFISTVNHELRTPLTAIQGALGLLKSKTQDVLDGKARRLIDISYKNCLQLAYLVNDILDMEKITAGKMEYKMEPYLLNDIINDVVEQSQPYAQQYHVEFTTINNAPDTYIHADRNRIAQVITNLLSNAAKFSHPNDVVTITTYVNANGSVSIDIKDTGEGIPEQFRDKLFDRFTQADSSSTRKVGGSGLGLNIAKSIVDAHDGDISFVSTLGKGSTFTVTLPQYKS